jgi:hypothetical protein
METTVTFSVNLVGSESGNPFTGSFTVKTLLSRRDHFKADEMRRLTLGGDSDHALPALQTEAFMYSQLLVRVTDSPKWWKDSNGGIDLDDPNIMPEIFSLAIKAEKERKEKIVKAAQEAVK